MIIVLSYSSVMPSVQDLQVHAPLVIAEGAILIVVCSVLVLLRFYARRISRSGVGLDDFAIAAALVSLSCQNMGVHSERTDHTYSATAFRDWNGNYSHRGFEIPLCHSDKRLTMV